MLINICCLSALAALPWPVLHAAPAVAVVDAAMQGNRDAVRSLLKDRADVNTAQADGMTALNWEAQKGDVELAKLLLYASANVKAGRGLIDAGPPGRGTFEHKTRECELRLEFGNRRMGEFVPGGNQMTSRIMTSRIIRTSAIVTMATVCVAIIAASTISFFMTHVHAQRGSTSRASPLFCQETAPAADDGKCHRP